jgi:type I restriction enzyme, S subunit
MDERPRDVTPRVPLYAVTRQVREVVDVRAFDAPLLHFSIPALEATGGPALEDPSDIESAKLRVRGGEVLISRLNPRKSRVAVVPERLDRIAVASTEFVVLDPVGIERRFLAYLLASEVVRQQLDAAVRSVTRSHQRVDPEEITQMRISLPPADRQRQIADFLDDQVARIDNIITARERQAAAIEEDFHSEVFTRLQSRRDSVDVAPLRRYVDVVVTGSTPDETLNDETGLRWYTPASITANGELGEPVRRVSAVGTRSAGVVRFPAESVLIVGIGATAGRVVRLTQDASGNQQMTAIKPNARLNVDFLFRQLQARGHELLTTAPFTTLPILNNDVLRRFELVVPERSEQDRLAAVWDAAACRRSEIKAALTHADRLLTELKRSLITAAVTGEFDVSSADGSRVPA